MYIKRGLAGENLYELQVYGENVSDESGVNIIELKGFKVEDFLDEKVQRYIKRYQGGGRASFQVMLDRSQIYVPYIKKVFREQGVPEDLAYLPIIESGFHHTALSPVGAHGIWQFMPRTGMIYDLDISWWVDERRDPEKSTLAAAKHLSRLYKNFKSWVLALAAYNAGGGRIGRAIRKHKTNIFWELSQKGALARETQYYIPKFIAAVIIAKNPERYGFKINKPAVAFPNYEKVYIDDAADLAMIANAIDDEVHTLKILNPELKQWITPPQTKNYPLRIPIGKRALFEKNFGSIPQSERVTFRRHVIRTGETLSHLSAFYNVPIKAIRDINRLKSASHVRVGKTMLIPIRGLENAKQIDMKQYKQRVAEKKEGKFLYFLDLKKPDYPHKDVIYCVDFGDTLWEIARRYNVSIEEIRAWNKLKSKYVQPGDEIFLRIPLGERPLNTATLD